MMPSSKFRGVRKGSALKAFLRNSGAGPIVEFAIIVPVLLLLLFGIIDFARAFFQRNNLVAAAREGARFAAVQALPCSSQPQIRARVITYFQGVGSAPPANNATAIPIDMDCTTPTSPEIITVRIQNYPFQPVTPVFGMLGRNLFTLSARASYRWERS